MSSRIEPQQQRAPRALGLRKLLLLTALCGCWLAAPHLFGQAAVSPADRQNFQQAMDAVNSGDAAKAEPLLQDLHTRYPHNFEINEALGLIFAAQNNLPAALPLMTAAAAEQPGSDAAAVNLGIACLRLGHNADAARALDRAVHLNPHNARAWEALGQARMQLQQPRAAAVAFQVAIASGDPSPTLLYNAALADFDAGKPAAAAQLLARMTGVETSPEAQSLFGDVEEKLGNYKEAAQHYIDAARLAPTETNEYVLGVEFLRHWTFEPAAQQFELGLRQFPASRRMLLGLGIARFGDHNYPQAIAAFSDLLATDPDNATWAGLLGRACAVLTEGSDPHCAALVSFAQKHPQQAKIATEAAVSIMNQPDNPEQLQSAQHLLDAAIRAAPNLPEAHYQRGLLLQKQLRWEQSIPDLLTAIRLKPDYSAAHYRLALAYARTGHRDRAQTEIALQKKYSGQETRDRDRHLTQMQTLLVTMR